ncbi:MAG: ZIP family metal transporter [Nanoarchaeota archaeon]
MVFGLFFLYALISVLIVSLISLVGVISLSVGAERLRKFLIYLISFSAGALLGDAFIHLLPEIVEKNGFGLNISFYLLSGIAIFFILEKLIHWNHCHAEMISEKKDKHIHAFAYTNLIGDGLHNFLDGVIIASSYLVSMPAGIATTIAVVLHEIPQEIGDFAVLLHGGFSKGKALLMNFASALLAVLGVIVVFVLGDFVESLEFILVPVAAGGFVYIAGSDLIPELHKHSHAFSRNLLQVIAFIVGIGVMALLLLLE